MGTIYVMWGGPGWYTAKVEDGCRVYYLVASREVNFGVGPTLHFESPEAIRAKWGEWYNVEIAGETAEL